jgi:hypothetical protein
MSVNGTAQPENRTAGYLPGAMKTIDEPKHQGGQAVGVVANTGFFRDRPQDLFDLCAFGGKTVELYWDLGQPEATAKPTVVLMPGAEYLELIAMRDKIRAITGQVARAG